MVGAGHSIGIPRGGSIIVVDVDRHITLASMMNQMAPGIIGGPTATALITGIYSAV